MSDLLGSALENVPLPSADEALVRSMYPGAVVHKKTDAPKWGYYLIAAGRQDECLTGWCMTEAAAWKSAAKRVRRERATREGKGDG